jgi:DNA-3-methyladenine glycosylase II
MVASRRRPRWWREACAALAAEDADLAELIARHRPLTVDSRGDAFQTLTRSIIGQQISVKAAQAVWTRFSAQCGEVSPPRVLAVAPDTLRACGLSARKVEYCGDLARHFLTRERAIDDWTGLDDDQILTELTAVRGIGVWTVQMFMIFHLARPDVWPLGDLGLRRAIEGRYSRGRPTAARTLARLSARWTPWRTAATWYLWRSLENTPIVD